MSASDIDEFIKEYFEQDNCGTAYPIYFTIRDVEWIPSYWPEEGDRFTYVKDGEISESADSLSGLLLKLKANEDYEWHDLISTTFSSSFDADYFTEKNGGHIFAEKKSWKEQNMFLLKSEAHEHLKANAHHYSDEAHVFCHHAWRAPRQEKFFEALKIMAGLE